MTVEELHQSMVEGFAELRQEMDARLDKMEARFDAMDARFGEHEETIQLQAIEKRS
jgi:hypothetical protein